VRKIINIFILLFFGSSIVFFFWHRYHYGYRLEVMCNEAKGKTVIELESLIQNYGFDERPIVRFQNERFPRIWHIRVRPHIYAACFGEHDQKNVISTDLLWD